MQLYLEAENKTKAKYTPDWIQVCVNGKEYTFDIQGTIGYNVGLNCRVKGDLILWTLGYHDQLTLDYYERVYPDIVLTDADIAMMLKKAQEIVVGVYSQDAEELKTDLLFPGVGTFCWFDNVKKEENEVQFNFVPELNI